MGVLAAATAQYGSPEWLSEIRAVLVICWIGVAIVAWLQWKADRPDKPKPQATKREECKLHQRAIDDCPPGSHPKPPEAPQ